MIPVVLLVGDELADPLIPPLERALDGLGLTIEVVSPTELAATALCARADSCAVRGIPVSAVVFRAAPALLVAPSFTEDDAPFAAAELRAVWAHVLSTPGVAAVNRAYADTWFASSDWIFWRQRLERRGLPVAPRRLGRSHGDDWWVRWTGGIDRVPAPRVSERLGLASVRAGRLHRILCCAGEALEGPVPTAAAIATGLLDEGVVLGEAITDEHGRLVALNTLPPIEPGRAATVAAGLARWIHAHADR